MPEAFLIGAKESGLTWQTDRGKRFPGYTGNRSALQRTGCIDGNITTGGQYTGRLGTCNCAAGQAFLLRNIQVRNVLLTEYQFFVELNGFLFHDQCFSTAKLPRKTGLQIRENADFSASCVMAVAVARKGPLLYRYSAQAKRGQRTLLGLTKRFV
ncbi:hypothetical protein B0I18_10926 [Taibaiella chishuiensis]|uniref:Uncharacterized protein n=1 Tax=Taibaiella chishuiensis TaxID=1434707 RepID=A0A2P8CYH0_9BACT|nr:hypothetical protein B0I18_10926 [Taibaiella chishuiensis]